MSSQDVTQALEGELRQPFRNGGEDGKLTNYIRALLSVGLIALGLGLADGNVAHAGPIEDAVAANQKGEYAAALAIFRPLAEGGDADAQFGMGGLYWNGHGVAQDFKEALIWFGLAAAQAHADAQYALGLMHANGDGVAKDEKAAAKWFRLAADQGLAGAQYVLGVISDGGNGVAKDGREAIKWFRLAAKQGHAEAQFSLAVMYAIGSGAAKNAVRAQMWFNLAAAHGASDPEKWRDMWTRKMTSAQIAQAQAAADKCKASNYKDCD